MSASSNPLAAGVPALTPPSPTQVMVDPNGDARDVPVEQADAALKAGFSHGIDMTDPDGGVRTVRAEQAHDAISAGLKPAGITQGTRPTRPGYAPNVFYENLRSKEGTEEQANREQEAKIVAKRNLRVAQGEGLAVGAVTSLPATVMSVYGGEKGGAIAEHAATALGATPEDVQDIYKPAGQLIGGAAGGAASGGFEEDPYESAKSSLEDAYAKVKNLFAKPDEPVPSAPTPKPVAPHVEIDTPFDDATIRKTVDKDLSPEARQTLRDAAGDTIEAGSSPNNHLVKSVAPINVTITTKGLALNKLVGEAGPMSSSYGTGSYINDIVELKDELPASVQDQYAKDIDKEIARYGKAINSTDPREVLAAKRELDARIKSFTAPEEPIDSPAKAADAARVTLRRGFNDLLSTEIPATKPINEVLSKNLEVRAALDNKLGDIARDPVAADAQYRSELTKGKTILQNKAADAAAQAKYARDVARVKANRWKAGITTATAAGVGGLGAIHSKIAAILSGL
jgi:hypothetical protein